MINKLPVSEIKLNPNNPRLIKDDKFKKLIQSIKDFPEMANIRPVVLNKDHIILGGNMRFRAMKEAGWKEIPVAIVDLPEDKQREFVIKDNVSGGEWDWDILANEWDTEQLDDWGLDLPKDMQEEPEIEEDEAPEVSEEEPKSKLGKIYQLGNHRVMCGDSTDKANVELLMNGNKADMVFTDPPYGMNLDTDYTKMGYKWNKKHSKVLGDDSIFDYQTYEWLDIDEQIWFGANYYAKSLLDNGSWFVWDKRVNENYDKMFGSAFELAWSKKAHKQEIVRVNATLFGKDKQDIKGVHPTQKPLQVCSWFINKFSNNIVLDLFLGSGSTLIACEQTDRICYGMELDPKYVDVIRKRWAKFVYPDTWEERWEELTPVLSEK